MATPSTKSTSKPPAQDAAVLTTSSSDDASLRLSGSPAGGQASSPATYTISALAREFDITPRAIRFYEDQGILSPSRAGRNRVYAARDRARLKLLLRGKRLGLSLSEVRSLIDMYDSPRDTEAQLREFLAVLARHRATLERQREDIGTTLAEISAHEKQCHALLLAQEADSAATAGRGDKGADAPAKKSRSRVAAAQE